MNVVFKKEADKRYVCANCGKQFNWGRNSCRYGKEEYQSIDEQRRIDRSFCSNKCFDEYFKNHKKHQ